MCKALIQKRKEKKDTCNYSPVSHNIIFQNFWRRLLECLHKWMSDEINNRKFHL